MILLGAGVISVITTILFMLTEGTGVSGAGFSEGPSFGAYIGLICGVAVAAGGYLMRTDPRLPECARTAIASALIQFGDAP